MFFHTFSHNEMHIRSFQISHVVSNNFILITIKYPLSGIIQCCVSLVPALLFLRRCEGYTFYTNIETNALSTDTSASLTIHHRQWKKQDETGKVGFTSNLSNDHFERWQFYKLRGEVGWFLRMSWCHRVWVWYPINMLMAQRAFFPPHRLWKKFARMIPCERLQ